MSWHKILLSWEQVRQGEEMKVQDQFNLLFVAAGGPAGMALFSCHDNRTDVELFFSPGSLPLVKDLIASYGGTSCQKPDPKTVALLVGHANAKDALL